MLTIDSGFTSADIETNDTGATATFKIAHAELIEEMDKTLVHIIIDEHTYWSADDLRQVAEYLTIIADELDPADADESSFYIDLADE